MCTRLNEVTQLPGQSLHSVNCPVHTHIRTVLYAAVVVLPLTLISVLLVKRAAAIHAYIATRYTFTVSHIRLIVCGTYVRKHR